MEHIQNISATSVSPSSSSPISRFYKNFVSSSPPRKSSSPPSARKSSSLTTEECKEKPKLRSPSMSKINLDQKCNDLEQVFKYFDENGDGKISPSELQKCVRTVGGELSDEEAEMAVRSSDADGDGLLGLEDFTKLMEGCGEEEKSCELKEAFEMFAVEGEITVKSLKLMLSRLGEKTTMESCKVMITRYDLDGDGVLSFDEFRMMMS